jgi:hypothetical protein
MAELAEAWLKLERGREHLKTLDDEVWRFHDDDPYAVVAEFDHERAQNVARFRKLKVIPHTRWGLIVGDAVHNARSALDYIAWRLAGSIIGDRDTLFPICRWPTQFDPFVKTRLARIHRTIVAEIRTLQPCFGPDPDRNPLWLLQELDARDKHKLIAVTDSVTRIQSISGTGKVTLPFDALQAPLQDKAILGAATTDQEVNVEFEFASYVALDSNVLGAELPASGLLRQIFWTVESVIERFERIFMGYPHLIP